MPLADSAPKDEAGKTVTFKDYLGKRPLLLGLVYYGCPHLCKLEINGIIQSLQSVAFNVGAEFEVALVSFDPKDTPEIAADKKKADASLLHTSQGRARLSFPDRSGELHKIADPSGGFSLSL